MRITYRDTVGEVVVTVDDYGVSMADGFAFFGDGVKDYKVPVTDIISVVQG